MASEPEVTELHEEIDKTRANLAEKLETLEDQVRESIRSTTEKAEETIENVTSTVQETVTQVKNTFDLNYQVQERPWVIVGGSVFAGLLVGAYVGRQVGSRPAPPIQDNAAAAYAARPPAPRRPGIMDSVMSQFHDEIGAVKELAIGYLAGIARDMIKEALPQLGPQVQQIMDSATTKIGGHPVKGPVFGDSPAAGHRMG